MFAFLVEWSGTSHHRGTGEYIWSHEKGTYPIISALLCLNQSPLQWIFSIFICFIIEPAFSELDLEVTFFGSVFVSPSSVCVRISLVWVITLKLVDWFKYYFEQFTIINLDETKCLETNCLEEESFVLIQKCGETQLINYFLIRNIKDARSVYFYPYNQ